MWDYHQVVLWIDICVFLPLTTLFICCVCCAKQSGQAPIIYYKNLLFSNLILLCMLIIWEAVLSSSFCSIIFYCAAMASLYFKLCIALERYFFIACPLLDCMRQTKGSVLVCVLVWVLCIVSVALAIGLDEVQVLRLIIYPVLPAPLFSFCSGGILKTLPAATSVPTEEKRRTVGTLILLLLNYLLISLPAITLLTLNLHRRPPDTIDCIILIFFLLSSFLDFILFVFRCKGPIDKLLAYLCCCRMETSSTGDVTDASIDRQDDVA